MKEKQEKKNRKILPYAGLVLRILVGLFAITIAVMFFQEMIKTTASRYIYVLSFLAPIVAVVIVGADVYMHYKLDIKPLRSKKKNQDPNPWEYK